MPITFAPLDFTTPPPEKVSVWRYQSFTKLLTLLTKRELYFSRVGHLRLDDPFEGSITTKTLRTVHRLKTDEKFATRFMSRYFPNIPNTGPERENLARNLSLPQLAWLDLAGTCFVSCWHRSRTESAALWRLYSGESSGVAIRSTMGRLANSLDTDRPIFAGSVVYADYDRAVIPFGNTLRAVFSKRNSFAYEREVRLLWWSTTDMARPDGMKLATTETGAAFPCDPSLLISEVVVSLYVPGWIADTIADTVKRLGFTFPVERSRLMEPPGSGITA